MCGVASSCWLRGALLRYMNDIVPTSRDLQTLERLKDGFDWMVGWQMYSRTWNKIKGLMFNYLVIRNHSQ